MGNTQDFIKGCPASESYRCQPLLNSRLTDSKKPDPGISGFFCFLFISYPRWVLLFFRGFFCAVQNFSFFTSSGNSNESLACSRKRTFLYSMTESPSGLATFRGTGWPGTRHSSYSTCRPNDSRETRYLLTILPLTISSPMKRRLTCASS